ncbi:hypothetical protein JCM8208_000821 [Rhodotorula glutinis]
MTPPSSSLNHEPRALPQPVDEHDTSIALGRPLTRPVRGDAEARGGADSRAASSDDQPPTRPVLNDLTDSLASTSLADSSPPLPPLPATSSSYPLLPDIPSSSNTRAPPSAPPHADDEVEALVDPSENVALRGARKSSLTPSEEALILPGVRCGTVTASREQRRPSVDGQSVASGTSGRSAQSGSHSFATAKNYFPLVQKRKTASDSTTATTAAGDPWGAPASPGAARASPAASPAPETPPPLRQARRRPSGSSSLASSARPTSVFPTIKPSRSASSSVFPLRSPPPSSSTAATVAADSPSTRSSDAGSLRAESLLDPSASPPPSILARPTPSPARSGTSPSLFSRPDSSLYAPSLAPSRRSTETTTSSSRRPLAKPSYASSRAPSHAEAFLASAPEPLAGPPSIFLNPTPQARSVKELLPNPKRRLSAFFGGGGGSSKVKASSSSSAAAAAGSSRGKSASVLDAALASSATWAAHRGEQWRAPASSSSASLSTSGGAAFGVPAGYRPAHQVRRQQEEAAARLAAAGGGAGGEEGGGAASPGGPTMGGGGEVPVSGEAIAEAFTRNQGREALASSGVGGGAGGARAGAGEPAGGGAALERTRSGVSMASVAGIDEPASAKGGGAFPVRREAFPTTTRARALGGSVRE